MKSSNGCVQTARFSIFPFLFFPILIYNLFISISILVYFSRLLSLYLFTYIDILHQQNWNNEIIKWLGPGKLKVVALNEGKASVERGVASYINKREGA